MACNLYVYVYGVILVPPFSITVINGSPIVSGNQVLVYFSTSKPATVDCILDGVRTNCKITISCHLNIRR